MEISIGSLVCQLNVLAILLAKLSRHLKSSPKSDRPFYEFFAKCLFFCAVEKVLNVNFLFKDILFRHCIPRFYA